MAVERIVDLEHQRYADREYEGFLPASESAEEAERAERRRRALLRLKIRSAQDPVVADLLVALGLDG